jgi:putative N-acetylmannosamine-6-phosphate epimerase
MILERLRGLVVSIQPAADSLLNRPEIVALLAQAAVSSGATGVRIEGAERIAAVRHAVDVPIVGLIKRSYPGFEPYITVTSAEIAEVARAGADVVAFDATDRARPGGFTVAAAVAAIRALGVLPMADCATAAEMNAAAAAGAAIVATTLCGYTAATRGAALPAIDLLRSVDANGVLRIVEGGVASPDDVSRAFAAGADAVVAGSAFDVAARVRLFAQAATSERA